MLNNHKFRASFRRRLSSAVLFVLISLGTSPPDARVAGGQNERTDYTSLADRIRETMRENLFSDEAFNNPKTQKFLENLTLLARGARNDNDFYRGFYAEARQLEFSHVDLTKPSKNAQNVDMSDMSSAPQRSSSDVSVQHVDEISVLTITSFNDVTPEELVDAFASIQSAGSKALMIDLRTNHGGTYMSIAVAGHLIPKPAMAGILFGRKARAQVLSGDLDAFPKLSPTKVALDEFFALMQKHGAVIGMADPLEPQFAGPVAVLTSRATASACEPLVEFLQRTHRAIIVGEKTAGAMLSASPFDIGGGWTLRIPVFDFVTAEGVSLEGRGVEPDVEVKQRDAMEAARKRLGREIGAVPTP